MKRHEMEFYGAKTAIYGVCRGAGVEEESVRLVAGGAR